jgi:hypothetical protein
VSAALFWQVVFWSSFVAFALVSMLIAVRGVGEIRQLLRELRSRDRG